MCPKGFQEILMDLIKDTERGYRVTNEFEALLSCFTAKLNSESLGP